MNAVFHMVLVQTVDSRTWICCDFENWQRYLSWTLQVFPG